MWRYLIDVPSSIRCEKVKTTGREKSSEQSYEEDLQDWQPCHDEQRPEPHLLPVIRNMHAAKHSEQPTTFFRNPMEEM
jgi:hypothetical protein